MSMAIIKSKTIAVQKKGVVVPDRGGKLSPIDEKVVSLIMDEDDINIKRSSLGIGGLALPTRTTKFEVLDGHHLIDENGKLVAHIRVAADEKDNSYMALTSRDVWVEGNPNPVMRLRIRPSGIKLYTYAPDNPHQPPAQKTRGIDGECSCRRVPQMKVMSIKAN
jgi:hypothetical protein